MSTTTATSLISVQDQEVVSTFAFFDRLLPPPRDFSIRLWNGAEIGGELGVRYTIALKSPGSARRMFALPVELALGQALIFGDFEIEGDLGAAFALKDRVREAVRSPRELAELIRLRRKLPVENAGRGGRGAARLTGRRHSRERDRKAIQYHYDVGNDFYALWLDERMIYTCAYFPTGKEDLATAQRLKLDHICRKLRLAAGERLLDIGCGWGGFCIHAAQNHGVHATGVTLSEEQYRFASERVDQLGLTDRVTIRLVDYRDLRKSFDKISSIGMFEAVGPNFDEYFSQVHRLLEPGGLFLNHSIAAAAQAQAWGRHNLRQRLLHRYVLGTGLIRERYIFPDGGLIPVSEANLIAEKAGLEVRDVENLREHYALTLRHWVSRLEARKEEAIAIAGESVYRTWRLYMTSSALEFDRGSINVNQTLFSKPKPGEHTVPLTRSHLYEDP
jgi:cyclopropane-fatty-acyl-phospholipid synthase